MSTGLVSDGGGLVRPVGSLEHWYSALLGKERGILYEDNFLQIGLQSRWAALCTASWACFATWPMIHTSTAAQAGWF
jgi:hypothetical protein